MKSRKIFKNSIIGLLQQAVSLILAFITRNLFIKFIGIELLGLNETLISAVSTLSLGELGLTGTISYRLYSPLALGNEKEVNDVVNVLRAFYHSVGCFFIIAGIAMMPVLKLIITGIQVTKEVYFYFIITVVTSASTYFLAYEKNLLYADQQNYVVQLVDLVFNIIFVLIHVIIVVVFHNYFLFLLVKLIQTVLSGVTIHFICRKRYTFLRREKVDKRLAKVVFKDAKFVFPGQIATYIYGSTDNLVISSFVSTASVGLLGNYTAVSGGLKMVSKSLLTPVAPSIGNLIATGSDDANKEKIFLTYTHFMFILAAVLIVPLVSLSDSFIMMWIGSRYLLSAGVSLLLGIEFYIHIIHNPTVDYINASGLFREKSNVEILGAVTNVIVSLVLVKPLGIQGVLMGTVISQLVFWIGRSYIVYFKCLDSTSNNYLKYWLKNIQYIICFAVLTVIGKKVANITISEHELVDFLFHGVIIEIIVLLAIYLIWSKTKEQKYVMHIIFQEILHMSKK